MKDQSTLGRFSWCELVTTDVEGAKEFYETLFGWDLEDMSMDGIPYTVVKAGDEALGGIMAAPPEARAPQPMWGTYVTVEDIDAVAAVAEELGGRVLVTPRDVPNVGRVCMIQDPQGAIVSAIAYTG